MVPERQSPVSTLTLYSMPVMFVEFGRIAVVLFLALYLKQKFSLDADTLFTLGMIAIGVRLASAVIVGPLADLLPGRAGRRRIFLGIGTILLGVGTWFTLLPFGPDFVFLAGAVALMEFGALLFHAAHLAWGIEMTRTYHSRTAILQWRTMATCLGWLLGLFMAFAMDATPTAVTTKVMGWSAAVSSIGLVFTSFLFITLRSERMPEDYRPVPLEFDDGLLAFASSPVVRRVAIAGMILASMVALDLRMHSVILDKLLDRPETYHMVLLVEILSALLMTAVWSRFSLNWGKANAAAAAFLWAAVSGFPLIIFTTGDLTPIVLFVCLRASAYGGLLALLLSMSGDAADVDLFRTGKQRTATVMSGLLFLWLGAAAGTFYGLEAMLELIAEAPEDIRLTFWRMLYAIVPFVALSIGAVVIRSNPVTASVHAEMREEIARQKKRILALDMDD